ncbi:hypothetical protein BHM03_00063102 [Ensete ventricosum]|nr:hypothetical protein BHM03_00063102 [Ensete ventricosum]
MFSPHTAFITIRFALSMHSFANKFGVYPSRLELQFLEFNVKLPEITADDEEIIASVVAGKTPSYVLESKLGDCLRAAGIRREALRRTTGRTMEGLPLDGFDYASILGQCCELPVGYVQLPVGIAGPLLLDGRQYYVPMATTEGCLVASTNRGCKAIVESGGAASVVLRDGMTRAPALRLPSARRAAELKAYMEEPNNFETISLVNVPTLFLVLTIYRKFPQIEQVCQAPGCPLCTGREECLHEIQVQHRRCHGDEHGLQGCPERLGLSAEGLPGHGRDQYLW